MAVLLYSNGIIEEIKANHLAFTDEELLKMFNNTETIKSKRLLDIPNTWCLWGSNKTEDPRDYARLGSEILEENIYSPLLILHDSEIDPEWRLTDDVIIGTYPQFHKTCLDFINDMLLNIIEKDNEYEEIENTGTKNKKPKKTSIMNLLMVGPTDDKRVLWEFAPNNQSDEFYKKEYFYEFVESVFNFLSKKFKMPSDEFIKKTKKQSLIIYADKQYIIAIREENVKPFIESMISCYTTFEEYEKCSELKKILKTWDMIIKKQAEYHNGNDKYIK